MANFECKICGAVFKTERELKRHARKEHDCTIFMAMNPQSYKSKPKSEPTNVNGKLEKARYNDAGEVLAKVDGAWVYGKNLTPDLRKRAEKMAKKDAKNSEKKVKNNVMEVLEEKGVKVVDAGELVQVETPAPKKTRTKKPDFIISYSQIRSFLKCPQKWNFAFINELAPRIENPALTKGTLIHNGLEAAWLGAFKSGEKDRKKQWVAAIKAMKKAIENTLYDYLDDTTLMEEEEALVIETAQISLDVCRKAFAELFKKYEPLVIEGIPLVEYEFKIPVKRGMYFVGKIDLVAKERGTNKIWLMDYKTTKAFQPSENQQYNLQKKLYKYALNELAINTVGSIIYQIWHEPPNAPALNKPNKKTGEVEMSRALIKTDWKTYKKCLEEAGLDPENYLDMKDKLATVEFFRESRTFISDEEAKATFDKIAFPAIMQIDKAKKDHEKGKFNPIRVLDHTNMGCGTCEFEELCMESLRDKPIDWLIEGKFTHNTYVDRYKPEEVDG